MAVFGGMTLTQKGIVLQSKAQTGTQIKYTRMAAGDGTLTGQSIPALNGLISPKMNLPIQSVRLQPPNKAVVGVKFSNQDVTAGFYHREMGLFAEDPDVGEILYAYANSGVTADYIPGRAEDGDIIEKVFNVAVTVGTTTNITAVIDDSLVFVQQKKFDVHKHTGAVGDAPKIGSDGLAAGAANDAAVGNRTVDDTKAPTGNAGTLSNLFNWFGNRIKAITGKAKWTDAPAMTLEEAKTHADTSAGGVHGSTSAATANRLMHRDAQGRAKVAAPAADDDIARKAEVDAAKAASIPLTDKGAVGGVPALDSKGDMKIPGSSKSASIRLGGGNNGYLFEAAYQFTFANETAGQKIRLISDVAGPVTGFVEITVTGSWSHLNNVGRLTKRLNVQSQTNGTIDWQQGLYTDVTGPIVNNLRIGDLVWDAAISKYVIPIESITSYGNTYVVHIRHVGTDGSPKAWSLGPVYTGAASVLPAPVQTLSDDFTTMSGYGIQKHKMTLDDGQAITFGGDVNTLTKVGIYYTTLASTNKPPGASAGLLEVYNMTSASGSTMQRFFDFANSRWWYRYGATTSTWGNWAQIWTGAKEIPQGADLNTYLLEGDYRCSQNVIADKILNGPPEVKGVAFHLRVSAHAGVMQELTTYSPNGTQYRRFIRNIYSGQVGTWVEIMMGSRKDVAYGYAGLDSLARISSAQSYPIGMVNLLPDSGRFIGPDQDSFMTTIGNFMNSPFFSPYNGTTVANGGKFIGNNNDFGGTAGALPPDVRSLMDAMVSIAGRGARYGSEFYIASYTMGPGTASPTGGISGNLMTTNPGPSYGGVDYRFTVSFWIRVKSGTKITLVKGERIYKNGILVNTHLELTPADGWVHVETTHYANAGYSNAVPSIYANAGDVVQIALPVVVPGARGPGIHHSPILSASPNAGRIPDQLPTSTGNAASLAVNYSYHPTLAPGQTYRFKCHGITDAGPTLNINGLGAKPVRKPNGTGAKLVTNGVYTVVYDGSAFILQGEGGEYGTATAADVKTGKSIGTEDGVIQGSMPDRGAVTITPGQTAQAIPAGYHNGSGTVLAVSFDSAKVLTGTTIAGKAGTMPNRSGVSTDNAGITAGGDGNLWFNTPAGYYDPTGSVRGYDADFISNNIALGKNIFGVNGSVPRYTRKDVYGDARYLGSGEVYQIDTVGSPQYGYYLVMNLRMTGTNGRLVIRKISSKETVAEVGNPDKILGIMFSPGSLDLAILYGSSPSYSYATLISNQYNSGEGWEIVLIGDLGGTCAINTYRGSSIGVRESF